MRRPGCFRHEGLAELFLLARTELARHGLGCFELEEAARLVRRRWPSARILLIRSGEKALEDPLYDLRLRPPVEPNTLMAILSGQTRPTVDASRPLGQLAHAS